MTDMQTQMETNKNCGIGLSLMMALATALAMAASVFSAEPAPTANSAPATREWKINVPPSAEFSFLAASADGRFLAYSYSDSGSDANIIYSCVLDTQTSQRMDLLVLLKETAPKDVSAISNAAFSNDGKYLAAVAEKAGRCTAFLVTLADKRAQRLGQAESVGAFWGGDKLYLSIVDEMTLGPILQVNPETGKTAGLKLAGALVGAASDGKWLLCVCDPNNPSRPLSSGEYQKGHVYKVSPDGKMGESICPAKEAFTGPQLSANNKYFARVVPPSIAAMAQDVPPTICKVTSLVNGKEVTIKCSGSLIGVSNTGETITTEPLRSGVCLAVKATDADGNSRTLAKAISAIVAGNRLYYVDETSSCVRCIPLVP